MTDRERILAAIRGETPDRIPWVPRLEFWYRGRKRLGTLPAELRDLSIFEIAERLGVGYYSVVPDFTNVRDEMDMIDRGLGLFRLDVLPYRATLEGVERRITRRGLETTVEYHTPVGSVTTEVLFTEEMLAGGASIGHTSRQAIRRPEDFDVVSYIFSHIRVEPQVEGYRKLRERVGDHGIVIGYLSGSASPMHHILKDLMPLEEFFYARQDCPEKIEKLVEAMEPYYEAIKRCGEESPAEVVMLGANYDDAITYPPFFRRHILPSLRDCGERLRARGKFLMTHTDGESRKLLPLFLEAGFDVADSVCPHPMTSVKLEEFLEAFRGRIAIWGGIPSILFCRDSATQQDCRRHVDSLLERYGRSTRFILGVSDMVTVDAEWDRLRYVTDRVLALD